MNSKTTGIWFVIAAALFVFIFIWERQVRAPAAKANVLPGLKPSAVTRIEIFPADSLEICAVRTNRHWQLTRPVIYPAQTAAVEALLDALQKLAPAIPKISPAESSEQRTMETEFGFDNPQYSINVEAGDRDWQLKVGNKTAPGDQVYLRVTGADGTFVTDAGWLGIIPRSANDWRDTALVDVGNACDRIVLTNGTKAIELQCDATNHLWRMLRPLQARADSERIAEALQKLYTAHVSRFVTDDTNADLTAFGLQPADLDLWLDRGTNFVAAIHIGIALTNDATQVFARREGWNTIAATAREPLSFWYGAVNDFRDPRLLELTAPVAEIEVRGRNSFTLQRHGSNDWVVAGEKFPADADNVQQFIKLLAGFRVAEFVKDVATLADLPAYGLATPTDRIILRSAVGDTNAVIAQLLFGATQTNEVFVKRADEIFVYGLSLADFNTLNLLYGESWEFRDRRIWDFDGTNVAAITLHQNGKTRQIVHNGVDQWILAPGSQGIINPPAIEETAYQLGKLTAYYWLGRNITEPEKYGLNTNNLQITVELKNGEKRTVDFGTESPKANTALAAVTLDGERWAFVFPQGLYQLVLSCLTIPVPQGGIP
ncbi:MAG: DUF4340 domain-containing protein [Verrucomicrobiota bacterium]|jgi:hypothetical protein